MQMNFRNRGLRLADTQCACHEQTLFVPAPSASHVTSRANAMQNAAVYPIHYMLFVHSTSTHTHAAFRKLHWIYTA